MLSSSNEKKINLFKRIKVVKISIEIFFPRTLTHIYINIIQANMRGKKVLVGDHILKFNELITLIESEIDKKKREMKNEGNNTRCLSSILRRVVELKKQVPRVIKYERKLAIMSPDAKRNAHFLKPLTISNDLAAFLKVEYTTKLRRSDIITALCVYCHYDPAETRENVKKWEYLNPGGVRDLRDPNKKDVIIPDELLNDLLKYDQYTLDVKDGKISQFITDKETGLKTQTPVTSPELRFFTISKLVSKHITKK